MAFNTYKQLADVLKKYRIQYKEIAFGLPVLLSAPEVLREDIQFTLEQVAYDVSEAAICENLIYPVLKTAWRQYADTLAIWSHQPIGEGELSGIPDYIISKRSELGKIVFESPFIAVIEAKKDDFTNGWAQCGLEMYIMQSINEDKTLPIHGIVSNGETWEMARLDGAVLTKYSQIFVIQRLDELYTVLANIFAGYSQLWEAGKRG
jgi:hypothetical protein